MEQLVVAIIFTDHQIAIPVIIRDEIYMVDLRLHRQRFTNGSLGNRNVLINIPFLVCPLMVNHSDADITIHVFKSPSSPIRIFIATRPARHDRLSLSRSE